MMALALCVSAQAATVAEQYLLSAVNQERVSRGLQPLQEDEALTRAAYEHAQVMAGRGTISHQFPGEADMSGRASAAGARFDRLAENVGEGPSAVFIHEAWMHSAGHRANILDPAVDSIGIAVVVRGRQLYAVEDFERKVLQLTLEQQEEAVGVLLDQAGLELIADPGARASCEASSGYAGNLQPSFLVRYTAGDLSKLPSQLEKQLKLRQNTRASVGACLPRSQGAFAMYRLAVVLYP